MSTIGRVLAGASAPIPCLRYGCAPQKCFIDNGEAWSANEVTINWNALLARVAAYLDEAGAATASGARKNAALKK